MPNAEFLIVSNTMQIVQKTWGINASPGTQPVTAQPVS